MRMGFIIMKQLSDREKLKSLLKKKEETEAKLKFRMSRFRGVAHESASGELAYSELKVLEDYLESLNCEIEALRARSLTG